MLSLSSFLNTLISYFYFYSTPYTHTHTTITPFLNTYKGKSTILGSVLPRHEKTSKASLPILDFYLQNRNRQAFVMGQFGHCLLKDTGIPEHLIPPSEHCQRMGMKLVV